MPSLNDTIRYDGVYLTCSKKLTSIQLSLPHGTNKKLKCETKNKTMSMIGPVQYRCLFFYCCCLWWRIKLCVLSWRQSGRQKKYIKMGRICWKGRFWAWSEGVMDDESGDDNRDELTSEWGGNSRHDRRDWRNESGSWFQRRGDAYLN